MKFAAALCLYPMMALAQEKKDMDMDMREPVPSMDKDEPMVCTMEVCDDYEWYVKDKYCVCGPKPWMECHPYYGNDCLQWKYDEKMGRDVMKNPYQKEEWYVDNKEDHMEEK